MAALTPEQQAAVDAENAALGKVFGHQPGGVADRMSGQLGLQQSIGNGAEAVTGIGNETWDDVTKRYRDTGAAMQGRAAPTLDQGQADQARALQMGGLGLLRAQADGSAPSSAAILSQRTNQDAVRNAALATTGAKSAGSAIAGNRAAEAAAGGAMLAGNAANANARAGEISRGQGAYFGGAAGMRGQDIGAATSNAQLEAQQRALNEAGQQSYEDLAWNARNAQQQAGMQAQGQLDAQKATLGDIQAGNQKAEMDNANTAVSTMAAVGTAGASLAAKQAAARAAAPAPSPPPPNAAGSDERMKMHIGSLSALMKGRH